MGDVRTRLGGRVAVGVVAALMVGVGVAPAAHAAAVAPLLGDETVVGGQRIQAATVLETGLYLTERVDTDAYFRVDRTVPGSTIWVAVSVVEDQPTFDSFVPAMLAEGNHADDCGSFDSKALRAGGESSFRTGSLSTRQVDRTDPTSPEAVQACTEAEYVVVKLPARGREPEMPAGTPVQLLVWEEAPVTDVSDLPAPQRPSWDGPSVADERTEVVAGTSSADAPVLEDGSYVVTVPPLDNAIVGIRLDWGQHAEIAARPVEAIGGGLEVGAQWHMPLGSHYPEYGDSDNQRLYPEMDALDVTNRQGVEWMSPTVAYRDLETAPYGAAAAPGVYLLELDGQQRDGVQLELDVQAAGEVSGAPTYDEAGADLAPMPEITAGPEEAGDAGGTGDDAAAEPTDSRPWAAILGLFMGAGVFTVAGVVSWGRARPTGRAR